MTTPTNLQMFKAIFMYFCVLTLMPIKTHYGYVSLHVHSRQPRNCSKLGWWYPMTSTCVSFSFTQKYLFYICIAFIVLCLMVQSLLSTSCFCLPTYFYIVNSVFSFLRTVLEMRNIATCPL